MYVQTVFRKKSSQQSWDVLGKYIEKFYWVQGFQRETFHDTRQMKIENIWMVKAYKWWMRNDNIVKQENVWIISYATQSDDQKDKCLTIFHSGIFVNLFQFNAIRIYGKLIKSFLVTSLSGIEWVFHQNYGKIQRRHSEQFSDMTVLLIHVQFMTRSQLGNC